MSTTVKPVLSGHQKKTKIVFQDHYHLMQIKNIAECSKRAFCNTFDLHYIIVPFVLKTFVLSFFDWQLMTGFTVFLISLQNDREIFRFTDTR